MISDILIPCLLIIIVIISFTFLDMNDTIQRMTICFINFYVGAIFITISLVIARSIPTPKAKIFFNRNWITINFIAKVAINILLSGMFILSQQWNNLAIVIITVVLSFTIACHELRFWSWDKETSIWRFVGRVPSKIGKICSLSWWFKITTMIIVGIVGVFCLRHIIDIAIGYFIPVYIGPLLQLDWKLLSSYPHSSIIPSLIFILSIVLTNFQVFREKIGLASEFNINGVFAWIFYILGAIYISIAVLLILLPYDEEIGEVINWLKLLLS